MNVAASIKHTIISWDTSLFLLINRDWSHPVLDIFFMAITSPHFWIIPAIIAALVFLKLEKKRAAVVLLLSIITVAITDPVGAQFIKPFVHRLRPCNPDVLVEGGRFLLGFKSSPSFPSNHAMNMFGQAMLYTLFYPRLFIYFFTFASLVAYSRVYVGVHYPLDVIGGGLFGVVCALVVFMAYRWIARRFFHKPGLYCGLGNADCRIKKQAKHPFFFIRNS